MCSYRGQLCALSGVELHLVWPTSAGVPTLPTKFATMIMAAEELMAEDARAAKRDVNQTGQTPQVSAPSVLEPAVIDIQDTPTGKRHRNQKIRILFLAANTYSRDQLALDNEYRSIEQSIDLAQHAEAFWLIPKLAVRQSDLQRALLKHKPDVVHFACHCSAQAEMMLLSDGDESAPITASALSSLFGALPHKPTLVVLNACFASTQACAVRALASGSFGNTNGLVVLRYGFQHIAVSTASCNSQNPQNDNARPHPKRKAPRGEDRR